MYIRSSRSIIMLDDDTFICLAKATQYHLILRSSVGFFEGFAVGIGVGLGVAVYIYIIKQKYYNVR